MRKYPAFLWGTLIHPGQQNHGQLRFILISYLIGAVFASFITNRIADVVQTLPMVLIIPPAWGAIGLILHGFCKIMGGRGDWRESTMAIFRIVSVLFMISFMFAFVFGMIASRHVGGGDFAKLFFMAPSLVGLVLHSLLMMIYLPLAVASVHQFGWARLGAVFIVIPAIGLFLIVYGKHAIATMPAVDEAGIDFIRFSKFDSAIKLANGDGVKIAICDWCFDMSPEAVGKYVDAASMIPDQPVGSRWPAHGEWMATLVHQATPNAKIIPIRTQTLETNFDNYLIKGIRYAADHGAAAVTCSMGRIRDSRELREAVEYAEKKGTVFINVHPVIGNWPFSADAINRRIINAGPISVAKHRVKPEADRDIYVWPYSLTATYGDGWGYSDGPPVVAGAVALMKSANPDLTPAEVKEILVKTARLQIGFRVLDAEAAVKEAVRRKKERT